jgi:hypothetical protein
MDGFIAGIVLAGLVGAALLFGLGIGYVIGSANREDK